MPSASLTAADSMPSTAEKVGIREALGRRWGPGSRAVPAASAKCGNRSGDRGAAVKGTSTWR